VPARRQSGTQTCGEQFQDAAHPQGWPYQEKVFGWIETPLTEPDGFTPRYPGTFDYSSQTGFFLAQPAHNQMCDSSDQCDYSQAQPCAHSSAADPLQWHCWWNKPVTGVCTANPLQPCNPGHTAAAPSAEPTVADPFPATCTNSLPAGTVLVNDGSVDDVTAGLNLAGCPQASQSNGGTFSWLPNFDTNLQPIGLVDLHQLGTGYGGHMLFTHLEDPAYKQWGGTAEWDLTASYDVYDVAVFVPGLGAAGTLSYTIYDSRGHQVGQPISVDQANYTNQWVNLGRFYLGPGAKVTTTNIVPGGDGTTDVAFDAVAFTPVASYAALGDSYSSGVGVGSANYDQGTNTSTNQCLRSADSYARQYGTAHGYPGVLTVHLACSGAVTTDLTTTNKYGEPAQISAIPKHARLVTVTIGGNDVGFADVLKQCLTPDPNWKGCESFYTQNNTDPAKPPVNVDYTISNLEPKLENVYNLIRAQVPTATIIALTYPSIFAPTSVASCVGPTVLGLPAQDIEWLISETNNLDNQVEIAAHRAGIQALDERYAFAGHEVCAPGSPDVNNALSGVPEAFHPNIAGYTKLAADLAAALADPALLVPPYKSLLDPRPGTPNAVVARALLTLFPRGRTTYNGAGYARNQFNKNNTPTLWITWPAAYASCTTRILVLHRDDEAASPPPGLCDLTSASWTPPYDAPPISTSNQSIPVDHVVPLKDAWANGAAGWTLPMRVDFANDLYSVQLIPASVTANSKKNDNSIEQWQPPNRGYWCTYAEMWVAIKYQWNLAIDGTLVQAPATTDEWDWLNNELNSCPPLSP
jgi:lysophospholipase L1-like esterase